MQKHKPLEVPDWLVCVNVQLCQSEAGWQVILNAFGKV